jgi:hypothetical protein
MTGQAQSLRPGSCGGHGTFRVARCESVRTPESRENVFVRVSPDHFGACMGERKALTQINRSRGFFIHNVQGGQGVTEFYLASADLDVAQPVVFDADQTAVEFNAYLNRRDGEYRGPSIGFVPDPDEVLREPCEVLSLFDGILIVHDRVRDLWSRALADDSVEWVPARYGDRMWCELAHLRWTW